MYIQSMATIRHKKDILTVIAERDAAPPPAKATRLVKRHRVVVRSRVSRAFTYRKARRAVRLLTCWGVDAYTSQVMMADGGTL